MLFHKFYKSNHKSIHTQDANDSYIRNRLQLEMNQLHLSAESKEAIIKNWRQPRKTLWQQCQDWGRREVRISFSYPVAVGIFITLFISGWLWTVGADWYFRLPQTLPKGEAPVYVHVVQTVFEGEKPVGEKGEIVLRKEFEDAQIFHQNSASGNRYMYYHRNLYGSLF